MSYIEKVEYGVTDRYAWVCDHGRIQYTHQYKGTKFEPSMNSCLCLERDAFILQARKEALEKAQTNIRSRNAFLDRALTVGQRVREDEFERDPPFVKHYRKLHNLEGSFWVPCDGEHYLMFVSLASSGFELVTLDRLALEPVLALKRTFIPTHEGTLAAITELKAALIAPDKDLSLVVEAVRELFRFQSDRDREQRLLASRATAKRGGGLDTGQSE